MTFYHFVLLTASVCDAQGDTIKLRRCKMKIGTTYTIEPVLVDDMQCQCGPEVCKAKEGHLSCNVSEESSDKCSRWMEGLCKADTKLVTEKPICPRPNEDDVVTDDCPRPLFFNNKEDCLEQCLSLHNNMNTELQKNLLACESSSPKKNNAAASQYICKMYLDNGITFGLDSHTTSPGARRRLGPIAPQVHRRKGINGVELSTAHYCYIFGKQEHDPVTTSTSPKTTTISTTPKTTTTSATPDTTTTSTTPDLTTTSTALKPSISTGSPPPVAPTVAPTSGSNWKGYAAGAVVAGGSAVAGYYGVSYYINSGSGDGDGDDNGSAAGHASIHTTPPPTTIVVPSLGSNMKVLMQDTEVQDEDATNHDGNSALSSRRSGNVVLVLLILITCVVLVLFLALFLFLFFYRRSRTKAPGMDVESNKPENHVRKPDQPENQDDRQDIRDSRGAGRSAEKNGKEVRVREVPAMKKQKDDEQSSDISMLDFEAAESIVPARRSELDPRVSHVVSMGGRPSTSAPPAKIPRGITSESEISTINV